MRELMRKGEFPGFAEGPINFAPTFKYDVFHRGRHHRQLSVRKAIRKTRDTLDRERRRARRALSVTENEEALLSDDAVIEEEEDVETEAETDVIDGQARDPDRTSVSSNWASSVYSGKYTTDADDSSSDDEKEPTPLSPAAQNAIVNSQSSGRSSSAPEAIQKILLHPAAQKAKSKWLSLMGSTRPSPSPRSRSSSPESDVAAAELVPNPSRVKKAPSSSPSPPSSPPKTKRSPKRPVSLPRASSSKTIPMQSDSVTSTPDTLPTIAIAGPEEYGSHQHPNPPFDAHVAPHMLASSSRPILVRSATSNTTFTLERAMRDQAKELGSDDEEFPRRGVYDTSSKQRVPSW